MSTALRLIENPSPPSEPQRTLYVVEFQTFDGWYPMPGDAYLDRCEAEKVAKLSQFPTRVVTYGPKEAS